MTPKIHRVLGIDPGFGRIGYGLIEGSGRDYGALAFGCIETDAKALFADRLVDLSEQLQSILKKYKPDAAGVEQLFFAKNTKTAMAVAHARGVILLELKRAKIPTKELTPSQVKQAAVGYGNAEKSQVQFMLKHLLNLKHIPKQDDAADALAIALAVTSYIRRK